MRSNREISELFTERLNNLGLFEPIKVRYRKPSLRIISQDEFEVAQFRVDVSLCSVSDEEFEKIVDNMCINFKLARNEIKDSFNRIKVFKEKFPYAEVDPLLYTSSIKFSGDTMFVSPTAQNLDFIDPDKGLFSLDSNVSDLSNFANQVCKEGATFRTFQDAFILNYRGNKYVTYTYWLYSFPEGKVIKRDDEVYPQLKAKINLLGGNKWI